MKEQFEVVEIPWCHNRTMRVLIYFFCISIFALSGLLPVSALAKADSTSRLSITVVVTHSHEHVHEAHHHHDSEPSTPEEGHHSDQHSHEHFVSCAHPIWLETARFETEAIELISAHSFVFKRSVPANRALGSIFRPPIHA